MRQHTAHATFLSRIPAVLLLGLAASWPAAAQDAEETETLREVTPEDRVPTEIQERLRQEDQDAKKAPGARVDIFSGGGASAEALLHVPIGSITPGGVPINRDIVNPVADDPEAVHRGAKLYNQYNCVGCHAPNGAGGMGPSLSNTTFLFGEEPQNIYLSILQGRPNGMPAWGGVLPDHQIWDLVAYIKSISREPPAGTWGRTTSVDAFTIEQVPAEYLNTVNPWDYTVPFSYGQAPFEKVKGSPPLETPGETQPPE